MPTNFFVTQDDKFKVYFLVEVNTGKPIVFSTVEDYQLYFKVAGKDSTEIHWYEFLQLSWAADNFIREQATEMDPVTGARKFNAAAWRELKFRYLLLSWSLTDGTGAKVPILREEVAGRPQLTAASFKRVQSVAQAVNTVALSFADRVLIEGESPSILFNEDDYKHLQAGDIPPRIAVLSNAAAPKN